MVETRFARVAGAILPATAFILPPLAVFAPLGEAPLLAAAALALLATDCRRAIFSLGALRPLVALLAALGLWATASAAWSILPQHSFLEGLRFLLISAGGLTVLSAGLGAQPAERRRILLALTAGLVLAIALLALERFANMPLTRLWLGFRPNQYIALARFDRGVTVLLLGFWIAFAADPQPWRRILLTAAVLAMIAAMASQTALLAALMSALAYVLAQIAPRSLAGAMIAAVLILGISIPLATPSYDTVVALHQQAPWIKASGIHRLLIWRFGADRVAERPFLGWGMDASRAMPGGKSDFNEMLPALHYGDRAEAMPLHPHDAALQWQMELGVPGLALGLGIVGWTLWQIGWRAALSRDGRAAALALAAAAFTVGLLSFGIWQAWWLSTLWLVSALYVALGGPAAWERSS